MKKKLLFCVNHYQYSDGIAAVLQTLVNALDKDKFDITILVLYKIDNDFARQTVPHVKIITAFKTYFHGLTRLVGVLPQNWLFKRLVKEEYDVEIAFQTCQPTKLIAAHKNTKAKKVAWIHGYGEDIRNHLCYDRIVSCSQSGRDKYQRVFPKPQSVLCLYNLVDEKRLIHMSKEQTKKRKNDDFTFISIGRLEKGKGFLRLLHCHKRLMDEGLLNTIWVIGEGAERTELESYIKKENLTKSVILWGFQKNPYQFIVQSDCLACASYSEGYSTVCTEASLLGVPVISTLVDGAKELIEANECGIVVDNNEDALYEGMKFILKNRDSVVEFKKNLENPKTSLRYQDRLNEIEDFFIKI